MEEQTRKKLVGVIVEASEFNHIFRPLSDPVEKENDCQVQPWGLGLGTVCNGTVLVQPLPIIEVPQPEPRTRYRFWSGWNQTIENE